MSRSLLVLVRMGLAGLLGLYAAMQVPVVLMIVGYKTDHLYLAGANDGVTPGDSYQRFVPLMNQMSPLQLGAAIGEIGLCFAAAIALAFGWRRAPWLVVAAALVQGVILLSMRALPAYGATWTATEQAQDWVTLAVLAAIGAAAFWLWRAPLKVNTP